MLQGKIKLLLAMTIMVALMATILYAGTMWLPPAALAAEAGPVQLNPEIVGWGYLAAALATGLSALAAGIAVGGVGAAAVGAIAEKPELFGRTLVFVGLAEGIAIYGLIISIMILNRLG